MTINDGILSLPRRERRAIYLLRKRRYNPDENWHNYRRWDGGKPNILSSVDLLRIKAEAQQAEKEAAPTGRRMSPALRVAGLIGVMSHRMFRRRAIRGR